MNIAKAQAIQGWMDDAELLWLAQQASTRHRIVEIGSWKGRSTRAMADNLPVGAVLYAVDTWGGSNNSLQQDELAKNPPNWLFEQFCENMSDDLLGVPELRVRPLRMTSAEAARCLSVEAPFDMIFIDAEHNYQDVKADIRLWLPLLSENGLLCGHDYVASWPGVVRAVDELFPKRRRHCQSIWSNN